MTKDNQNLNIKKPVEMFSLDSLLSNSGGSVFRLARMGMVRALEIHFGSPPLIDHLTSDKETTIALREIAQGRVVKKNKES